jgi:hypothetical protein
MNTNKKVGRKPIPVVYKKVEYNGKQYIVGTITSLKNIQTKFIFDAEFEEKIIHMNWSITSVGYASSHTKVDDIYRQVLLHNIIMDRNTFPGRGVKESVDHINRNKLDNRKENLRVITQSEQNINHFNRKRETIKLPDDCEIKVECIPRHIWYIKPNGLHGDRFGIDLKTEHIKWKTTSSKLVPLKDKLQEATVKLKEFYEKFPYLNPELESKVINEEELNNSFNQILALS